MAITLYDLAGADDSHRFSPNCWRSQMALLIKGLAYETVPWRFTEKDALSFSGQGKVPVIKDGEASVADSWEIARYLDATYPDKPILMPDPAPHPLTNFFRNWTDRVLHPAFARLVVGDLFQLLHDKDKPYFRETREKAFGTTLEAFSADQETAVANIVAALAPLRATVTGQDFIGGDRPIYADCLAFGAFQWARLSTPVDPLKSDDAVYAWRERMLDFGGGVARAHTLPAAA